MSVFAIRDETMAEYRQRKTIDRKKVARLHTVALLFLALALSSSALDLLCRKAQGPTRLHRGGECPAQWPLVASCRQNVWNDLNRIAPSRSEGEAHGWAEGKGK